MGPRRAPAPTAHAAAAGTAGTATASPVAECHQLLKQLTCSQADAVCLHRLEASAIAALGHGSVHDKEAALSLAVQLCKYVSQMITPSGDLEMTAKTLDVACIALEFLATTATTSTKPTNREAYLLHYSCCKRILLAGHTACALNQGLKLQRSLCCSSTSSTATGSNAVPASEECMELQMAVCLHVLVCISELTHIQSGGPAKHMSLVTDSLPAVQELIATTSPRTGRSAATKHAETVFKCLFKVLLSVARTPGSLHSRLLADLLGLFGAAAGAVNHQSKLPQYVARLVADLKQSGAAAMVVGVLGLCSAATGDMLQPALSCMEAALRAMWGSRDWLQEAISSARWQELCEASPGLAYVRLAMFMQLAVLSGSPSSVQERSKLVKLGTGVLLGATQATGDVQSLLNGQTSIAAEEGEEDEVHLLHLAWSGLQFVLKAVSGGLTDASVAAALVSAGGESSDTEAVPLLESLLLAGKLAQHGAAGGMPAARMMTVAAGGPSHVLQQGLSCVICAARAAVTCMLQSGGFPECEVSVHSSSLCLEEVATVGTGLVAALDDTEDLQWASAHAAALGKELSDAQLHREAAAMHGLAWAACRQAARSHLSVVATSKAGDALCSSELTPLVERRARALAAALTQARRLPETLGLVEEAVLIICQLPGMGLPSLSKLIKIHTTSRLELQKQAASSSPAVPVQGSEKEAKAPATKGRGKQKAGQAQNKARAGSTKVAEMQSAVQPAAVPLLTQKLAAAAIADYDSAGTAACQTCTSAGWRVLSLLDVVAQEEACQYEQMSEQEQEREQGGAAEHCAAAMSGILESCLVATEGHATFHARALVLSRLLLPASVADDNRLPAAAADLMSVCTQQQQLDATLDANLDATLNAHAALLCCTMLALDAAALAASAGAASEQAGDATYADCRAAQGAAPVGKLCSAWQQYDLWAPRSVEASRLLTMQLAQLPAAADGRVIPRAEACLYSLLQLWQLFHLQDNLHGMQALEEAVSVLVQRACGGHVSGTVASVAACMLPRISCVGWALAACSAPTLAEGLAVQGRCVPEAQQLMTQLQGARCLGASDARSMGHAMVSAAHETAFAMPQQHGLLWLVMRVQLLQQAAACYLQWGNTAQAWAAAQEALKLTTALQNTRASSQPATASRDGQDYDDAIPSGSEPTQHNPSLADEGAASNGPASPTTGPRPHLMAAAIRTTPAGSTLVTWLCASLHMASLIQAAELSEVLGQPEESACLLRECIQLARQLGARATVALASMRLAHVLHGQGSQEAACTALRESLTNLCDAADPSPPAHARLLSCAAIQLSASLGYTNLLANHLHVLKMAGPATKPPTTAREGWQVSLSILDQQATRGGQVVEAAAQQGTAAVQLQVTGCLAVALLHIEEQQAAPAAEWLAKVEQRLQQQHQASACLPTEQHLHKPGKRKQPTNNTEIRSQANLLGDHVPESCHEPGQLGSHTWPALQSQLLLLQSQLQDLVQGESASKVQQQGLVVVGLDAAPSSGLQGLEQLFAEGVSISQTPARKSRDGASSRNAAASSTATASRTGCAGGNDTAEASSTQLRRLVRALLLAWGRPTVCAHACQALFEWSVQRGLPHAAAMCVQLGLGLHSSLQQLSACAARAAAQGSKHRPAGAMEGAMETTDMADACMEDHDISPERDQRHDLNASNGEAGEHSQSPCSRSNAASSLDAVTCSWLSSAQRALSAVLTGVQNEGDEASSARAQVLLEEGAAGWLQQVMEQLPRGCVAACISRGIKGWNIGSNGTSSSRQANHMNAGSSAPHGHSQTQYVVCRISAGSPPIVLLLSNPGVELQTDSSSSSSSSAPAVALAPTAKANSRRATSSRSRAKAAAAETDEVTSDSRQPASTQTAAAGSAAGDGVLQDAAVPLLSELASVLQASAASMASSASLQSHEAKAAWWKTRLDLDSRMSQLLATMQNTWLGTWGWLLLQQQSPAMRARLWAPACSLAGEMLGCGPLAASGSTRHAVLSELLFLLLASCNQLTNLQLQDTISSLWLACQEEGIDQGSLHGGEQGHAVLQLMEAIRATVSVDAAIEGFLGQSAGDESVVHAGRGSKSEECQAYDTCPARKVGQASDVHMESVRRDAVCALPPPAAMAAAPMTDLRVKAPTVESTATVARKRTSRLKGLSVASAIKETPQQPSIVQALESRVLQPIAEPTVVVAETSQSGTANQATAAARPTRARKGRVQAAVTATQQLQELSETPQQTGKAPALQLSIGGASVCTGTRLAERTGHVACMLAAGTNTNQTVVAGDAGDQCTPPLMLALFDNLHALPWESMPSMRSSVTRVYRTPSLLFAAASCARLAATAEATAALRSSQEDANRSSSLLQKRGRASAQDHGGHIGNAPMPWSSSSDDAETDSSAWVVDLSSTFYLVNPGGDLSDTQASFEAWFSTQLGWQGTAGRPPPWEQLLSALQSHSLYVYMGHGSGEQYLPSAALRRLPACAANLLMGCSSGRLRTHGNYPPSGAVLTYLAAGCPATVANLWDVTDKDIDRFSAAVLRRWLAPVGCGDQGHADGFKGASSSQAPASRTVREQLENGSTGKGAKSQLCLHDGLGAGAGSLASHCMSGAVGVSRNECKLPHLIGAAPVCYGVPVHVHWQGPRRPDGVQ